MQALEALRLRFGQFLILFLWGNVALLPIISILAKGHVDIAALVAGVVVVGGATLIWSGDRSGVTTRAVTSFAMATLVIVLVYELRGHPYQIDVHMYFFAALALVAGWCDWRALLAYSGVVAVHHIVLNFAIPAAIFPATHPDLVRVLIHAVILILQAALLTWLVTRLAAMFIASDGAVAAANQANAEAQALAKNQEVTQNRERVELERRDRLAEGFVDRMQTMSETFLGFSKEVSSAAQALSVNVSDTTERTRAVSAAAEAASGNVYTVAAGAEELSASISEINHQVTHSAQIVVGTVNEATGMQTSVEDLSRAANQIGGVVELIRAIASQTNLLALNATIEAARAGDAGKGFAIVASEVKQLASQTSQATDEISRAISAIQATTEGTVASIRRIVDTISMVRDSTQSIASAVEQQSSATREIASNTQRVAAGTNDVSQNIAHVTEATQNTGTASDKLMGLSTDLSQKSEDLRREVELFVGDLKAA
ncbi:hypothetical protein MMA231_03917 (plasmid) [Asticcacaulis sp. MM231]|uniref:methyl-accepting chemotaxis protein n=1 Tax=Asticcacaulis sp. MM231 TaxID=3157666 RepID=UPI0032D56A6F